MINARYDDHASSRQALAPRWVRLDIELTQFPDVTWVAVIARARGLAAACTQEPKVSKRDSSASYGGAVWLVGERCSLEPRVCTDDVLDDPVEISIEGGIDDL
jgi:hypothetical protein